MSMRLFGLLAAGGIALALAAPLSAQEHGDHGGNGGHEGHGMAPAPTTGSWSYNDRANPRIHTRNRWEVIPAPGSANTFLATSDMSLTERCAALHGATSVIVDRALRAACGAPGAHDRSVSGEPMDQQPPHDMDHGGHDQDH